MCSKKASNEKAATLRASDVKKIVPIALEMVLMQTVDIC